MAYNNLLDNMSGEDDGISQLRAKLQKDASKYLQGVTNNDVDWLLRGHDIASSPQASASSSLAKPADPKSNATVASDQSQILLGNNHHPNSSLNNSNNIQTDRSSYRLQRSKTLDDSSSPRSSNSPVRDPSSGNLSRTLTNNSDYTTNAGRARSHSISSLKKVSEPKKGFLKKFFSSSSTSSPSLQSPQSPPLSTTTQSSSSLHVPTSNVVIPQPSLASTLIPTTISNKAEIDPKLEEYLKQSNAQSAHHNHNRSRSVSAPNNSSKVDAAGHLIPPHPDVSPLPSALTNQSRSEQLNTPMSSDSLRSQTSSRFSLLKRHSTFNKGHNSPMPTAPQPGTSANTISNSKLGVVGAQSTSSASSSTTLGADDNDDDYAAHISPSNVANKEARIPAISYLQKLDPLRKVAFAADVFVHDPPQQIPSRHPRKGNVEIAKDGTIRIHQMSEEEKKKLCEQGGGGVVVGGSGHLRMLTDEEKNAAAAQAHHVGEIQDDKTSSVTCTEEVEKAKQASLNLQIDKPMVSRHKQFDEEGHYIMDVPLVKLKLDDLYTKCCHLREILPIPATLKQIPKGSTQPLAKLHLRNPRPSMIEVLAFSDFIRIAPIISISLDGSQLSEQMFRVILSALVYKRHLEKLSLRNTPINAEGWKLLCWFLSVNKRLRRLDLTQCPALTVNTQKLKEPSTTKSPVNRMECNSNNRSDMDWSLMNATLIARGGIEEIILSGCKIKELAVYRNFIEMVVPLMTNTLGLAYNDLSSKEIEILALSLKDNHQLLGIDLGFNDLSTSIVHFINYSNSHYDLSKLKFLSFNSANLKYNDLTKKAIVALSKLRSLRFLDLSNNKNMFPKINDHLFAYLPLFPNLVRIHLDYNDLDTKSIVTLAEAMTLCPTLYYLSLLGNKLDQVGCTALVNGLKISKSIFTVDLDYEQVPESLRKRIGLYTMRNMERILYASKQEHAGNENAQQQMEAGDAIVTGESKEKIHNLHRRMMDLLHGDSSKQDNKAVESFLEEARSVRAQITSVINDLFALQAKGQLSIQGKESLVKFCFLDSSLEKALALIDLRYELSSNHARDYTTESVALEKNGTEQQISTELPHEDEDLKSIELKNDNVSDELNVSRTPSSKSLKELERGEGSVLKLKELMTAKDINTMKQFDEEEVKKVLLNPTDLHAVTAMLTKIKEHGIALDEFFKVNTNEVPNDGKNSDGLLVEALSKKMKTFNLNNSKSSPSVTVSPPTSDPEDSLSSANSLTEENTKLNKRPSATASTEARIPADNSGGSSENNSDFSSAEEEDAQSADQLKGERDAINETYDSLLNELVKVKTNTK